MARREVYFATVNLLVDADDRTGAVEFLADMFSGNGYITDWAFAHNKKHGYQHPQLILLPANYVPGQGDGDGVRDLDPNRDTGTRADVLIPAAGLIYDQHTGKWGVADWPALSAEQLQVVYSPKGQHALKSCCHKHRAAGTPVGPGDMHTVVQLTKWKLLGEDGTTDMGRALIRR